MQKRPRPTVQWDDLRYLIAVADAGTLLAAGKSLGVDRTTVRRRIDVLERTLGCTLFVLDEHGFAPTTAGRAVLTVAARMAQEAAALDAVRQRTTGHMEGTVRLATSASLGEAFVADILAFQEHHPLVGIEVRHVGDPMLAVLERRADLGIGLSHEAPARLDTVLLGHAEVAVYGAAASVERRTTELWIGWGDDLPKGFANWMAEYVPPGVRIGTTVNSWDALKRAVLSGGGVAPLWCMLADAEPGLLRVREDGARHRLPIWLVSAQGDRRTALQQAAWLFLMERIQRRFHALASEEP